MRIAITGTSGRVGRALANRFAKEHQVIELPRLEWELSDADIVARIAALDFEVLLHPGGITSLELCEDDPRLARRVNHEVPAALARACGENGRKMIFFSTDYVFGGECEGLHAEDEAVEPRSVYGRCKAEAESEVIEAGGCVLRVSWVFGPERAAFPDLIINRALAGEPLAAISDKTSLPCATGDLAEWVEALVAAGCPNEILHACQSGEPTSWHGMAGVIVDYLVELGHLDAAPEIVVQRLDEMTAFRAERPRHTAMSTARLCRYLEKPPRDWRNALREHVAAVLISR